MVAKEIEGGTHMNTRKDVSPQASLNEVAESTATKRRDYDRAMETLMSMARSSKDKMIPVPALLVALADFTTAVALAIGGDEPLRLIIRRMIGRIDDWNEGMFTDEYPS